MDAKPAESDTIEPEPVSEFKKEKAKRESKRKEVKVITEYTPEPVAATIDEESIASRAAEIVLAKMVAEKAIVDKTPESKTKTRPKPPAKKKTESPPATNKYFGWC